MHREKRSDIAVLVDERDERLLRHLADEMDGLAALIILRERRHFRVEDAVRVVQIRLHVRQQMAPGLVEPDEQHLQIETPANALRFDFARQIDRVVVRIHQHQRHLPRFRPLQQHFLRLTRHFPARP